MKLLDPIDNKTVIQLDIEDAALVFSKGETDSQDKVQLFVPGFENEQTEVSSVHVYLAACALLIDNEEFVNHALKKFYALKETKEEL